MIAKILRPALALGAAIDGFVGVVSMLFPAATGPLFDIPNHDPVFAFLGGGELIVMTFVYVAILCNLTRFRPLLWVVALDQLFAALLPAIEILRGQLPATIKIVGPMPLSLALAVIFIVAARAPDTQGQISQV
jgi:hypothetical protein